MRCTGWVLCQGHKGRKRQKTTREMAEWGLWPVIFQQHRAPGGAMWRWAAWLSAPTAGLCVVTFPCGMVLSYFVPCPLRPLCPYPSFSRLSVSALHIVYCQPTLSFFRTDTIHIFPKTAIFQKIFFKCLKLPVKQYGTLF